PAVPQGLQAVADQDAAAVVEVTPLDLIFHGRAQVVRIDPLMIECQAPQVFRPDDHDRHFPAMANRCFSVSTYSTPLATTGAALPCSSMSILPRSFFSLPWAKICPFPPSSGM